MEASASKRSWGMREVVRGLLGLAALVLAGALSTSAWTQDPPPVDSEVRRLAGSWELAISDADAQARINRGIDQAVDAMPPIVDMIAAGQLRGRTPISRRIEIALNRIRIMVRFDAATYDTAPGMPDTCPMVGNPGETVQVVQHVVDGDLQQVFTTPQGRRWNTFVLSEDGESLTFSVVVQSERLPAAMRFSLPYRRVSGP